MGSTQFPNAVLAWPMPLIWNSLKRFKHQVWDFSTSLTQFLNTVLSALRGMTAWGNSTHFPSESIIFHRAKKAKWYHRRCVVEECLSLCLFTWRTRHLILAVPPICHDNVKKKKEKCGNAIWDHQPCRETCDKHQAGFQWVISLYHNTVESNAGLMGRKYESRRAWVKMTHEQPQHSRQGTENRPKRENCACFKYIYKSLWWTNDHEPVMQLATSHRERPEVLTRLWTRACGSVFCPSCLRDHSWR